jgi:hypothetical protein
MPKPPYFFFQLKNVAFDIPIWRLTSSTLVTDAAYLITNAIYDSVYFNFFIVTILLFTSMLIIFYPKLYFRIVRLLGGGRSIRKICLFLDLPNKKELKDCQKLDYRIKINVLYLQRQAEKVR